MKASFIKRISAFIIDYFIITFVLSLIVTICNFNNNNLFDKIGEVSNMYSSGEITEKEYVNKVLEINYNAQKANIPESCLSIALMVGYYVIFAYLNKGQTLGKKIFKITVVEKDKNPSIKSLCIRSLFIYGIITNLYNVIFINWFNIKNFGYGNMIVSYLETFFIIISFFMILYKKDGRGLHDLLANTNVIEKER